MRRAAAAWIALALMLAAGPAAGKPPELTDRPEAAAQVGAATVRVLFWRIFDASLWSADGAFDWTRPFALALTYGRAFTAEQLTDETVSEMARLTGRPAAAFEPFAQAFRRCVADVDEGDRITAISLDADRTRFFLNGAERCTISAAGHRRGFFGIWLSDQSRFPEATARLTGGPA